MIQIPLKQFVPSQVCLKCNGCCRYKEADSAWRPKLGAVDRSALADLVNEGAYIETIRTCGEHLCRFLNGKDNTCGIYASRPFECVLYPFILSRTPDALKLYVHLSCPYVQDHLPQKDFQEYVDYLKGFFSRQDIRAFLSGNEGMFHDYGPFAPELLYLFDLSLS